MRRSLRAHLAVNPSRTRLLAFVSRAAEAVPAGGTILDAGAGEGMHRDHFRHAQYEAADFVQVDKQYGAVDYVCDLRNIPVEADRYDLVLLTQVLEHLPEPKEVLQELRRVLKPGGSLWLSTPLYFEEHEQPHDYYRYTQFGLQYLVTEAGFELRELEWLEGYFGTLYQQALVASRSLPTRPKDYGGGAAGVGLAAISRLAKPALLASAALFSRLELRQSYTGAGHPKNYSVVAVKPV